MNAIAAPSNGIPHEDELHAVGARLRALREERGFSQRELARRSDLTHTTISAIEGGRIDPSLGTLKKILSACEVRMGDFFQRENGLKTVLQRDQIATISSGGVHMRYVHLARQTDCWKLPKRFTTRALTPAKTC